MIGPRVRERRVAQKLSQEQLAHRAGVTLSAIQRLEAGQVQDPHYSTLAGIASALGATVEDLVGELAPSGKSSPPTGVGAPELYVILDRLGAQTKNLADPWLISRLQDASDVEVRFTENELLEEFDLLIPELKYLKDTLEHSDKDYLAFNKSLSFASQQYLSLKMFMRMPGIREPQEDALIERGQALLGLAMTV